MTDEILRELIEFIQNASPVVWSTLIKQVYTEAIATLAWCVFLVVVAVAAYKLASGLRKHGNNDNRKQGNNNYDWDDWYEEKIMAGYLVFGACTVIAFALFTSTIMHLVNPEFYAIKFILVMLGGE